MHQSLADSTFRIVCGNSSGSGFSFRAPSIVVTNHHVIEPHLLAKQPIFAVTESGQQIPAKLISYSDKSQYDFAILELQVALPVGRGILQPQVNAAYTRGTKVLFSGFPHGIHDLLVHEAIISAPLNTHAFFIDGSVNGGNSGGPIVDAETGSVVGIITQRRFLGSQSLQALGQQVSHLAAQCNAIAGRGSVVIMGINFGQFAAIVAQGLSALSQIIEANANSGIGIGFKIDYANNDYTKHGLP